jgi:hypothetical protein
MSRSHLTVNSYTSFATLMTANYIITQDKSSL